MLNFEIRYTKALVILCILAVIFIGLSFVLPIEYSYENHFLENLEVVILFLGIVICIGKIRDFILYDSIKFYVASIIIYILMIGRELSWGRVFYPIGMDKNGEQIFVKVHELWFSSLSNGRDFNFNSLDFIGSIFLSKQKTRNLLVHSIR